MSSPTLARWIPALTWLRAYDRSWLRGDVLAGITLAAYLLPAALGDASLANLPPEAGLYACLFGGLVFWIFCGSRYTAASVTSAISLVIGSSLAEVTGGNTARFGALAAGTAVLVSLIAFIAWLVKAGVMVHFLSESVLTGFKCGVALFLPSRQFPKLSGFHSAHGSFWANHPAFFSAQSKRPRLAGCLSPSTADGSMPTRKISRSRRQTWSPDSGAAFPLAVVRRSRSLMKKAARAHRSPRLWRQYSFLLSYFFSRTS